MGSKNRDPSRSPRRTAARRGRCLAASINSGTTDLTALIMFVVDATKPFSVRAKMPSK
jgi:hypothetical protein